MINIRDYQSLIVHVLQAMGNQYSSPDASSLILRTCVYESKLYYLKQIGDGPARGFPQIKLNTAKDILDRYLGREDKSDLRARIQTLIGFDPVALSSDTYMLDLQLQGNMILGIICCRLKYWMVPHSLPVWDDLKGQARYYKKYYNTAKGKGEMQDFIKIMESYDA